MDRARRLWYKSNMRDAQHILNCNLYGESGDLPDVAHCETIEARSPLHDWEYAPHRHARLHQILLFEQGGGEATLDGAPRELRDGTLVNVPMGIVHGYRFDHGASGLVVTLAAEMLDDCLRPSEGLRPLLSRPAVWPASAEIVETMRRLAASFAERDFGRAHILRSIVGLLLGQIARALVEHSSEPTRPASALLERFQTLIEAHFTEHWSVAAYANALATSPTHLSRIAREATGRPASRLIEERLVREARRYLAYTHLPISTIAHQLGFADPAYFSRVFARATRLSPSAFRERARG
ncbi:MAG: helix-turn-helix domain-containing protein [Neomegalonema sp.]|nr:helix-turn-helix domain-containing protein [Neomegalonema sp.]